MSFRLERRVDSLPSTPIGEISPRNKVIGEIVDFVTEAKIGSSRLKAFADYADFMHLKRVSERRGAGSLEQMQLALVTENIRQFKNGMKGYEGYNWQYELVEKLGTKLQAEIEKERQAGESPRDFEAELQHIKTFWTREKSTRSFE